MEEVLEVLEEAFLEEVLEEAFLEEVLEEVLEVLEVLEEALGTDFLRTCLEVHSSLIALALKNMILEVPYPPLVHLSAASTWTNE